MRKLNLLSKAVIISISLFAFTSQASITPGTANTFLESFSKVLNNKTTLNGKNGGPYGSDCSISIQKGEGRSDKFQTALKIVMKNLEGKEKNTLQINLIHTLTGQLFTQTTAEGTYQGFNFKFNGIENTVMYLHSPVKNYLHVDIQVKMGFQEKSVSCSIFDLK